MRTARTMPRHSAIGLDINSWEIRAVQLIPGRDGIERARHAVIPRLHQPSGSSILTSDDARLLRSVLERRGFEVDRVVISAPAPACSARIISLPDRSSGAPIDAIASAELNRARKAGSPPFAMATWYLPERGRGEQGLAVACERPVLDEQLDALELAGLTVPVVDLEEAALCRAHKAIDPESVTRDEIEVMLQIGWNMSFGVLMMGGVVVYTRRIPFGVEDMVTRLADRSGVALHEAGRLLDTRRPGEHAQDPIELWASPAWSRLARRLADELDTSVTYVSHAYRRSEIGRVVLAGFGSGRADIREILDNRLGMPVADFSTLAPPDLTHADAGRLALAYGLARRDDA